MKLTKEIIGVALSLWMVGNSSGAALAETEIYPDTVLIGDGTEHFRVWTNRYGFPIYVTKIQTFISTQNFDGSLVVYALRTSDRTVLTYVGWEDCNFMGGPGDATYKDDFNPDSIAIAPNDGITVDAVARGVIGPTTMVTVYIWYRLTP